MQTAEAQPQEPPLNLIHSRGARQTGPDLSRVREFAWPAGWALLALAALRHPRLRGLVLAGAAAGVLTSVYRHVQHAQEEERVDEMGKESFPSSDPPTY